MIEEYKSSKTAVVFGERHFLKKVDDLLDKNDNVQIILEGWRNKFLLPSVKELMGFSLNSQESKKARKLKYLIRLFWLVPLIRCYGLALEKKMIVDIKEFSDENFAVIELCK